MDIKQLMASEATLITRMFQHNNIRARINRRHSVCVTTGYISYALELAMDQKFKAVEDLQRELSTVLSNERRRLRLPGNVQAIPIAYPRLAIEVPHPAPQALLANNAILTSAAPHTMLAGRSYINGPQDEYVAFDSTPHVLIAGITGAGKSVLLQTMLLSLAANTPAHECKFVLVDLKNEDLVPFESLPHTLTFAGTREKAMEAIRWVQAEKDKRVATRGYKPYRVVLIIDEIAQLANNNEAKEILGDLASIGRAKDVNLIAATQSVTKEGGMGTLLKANFTVRLVGQVAPGQSQYATNRPGTHADLLPGRGAFLRCEGPTVYRFQGYYADEKHQGHVTALARQIAREARRNGSQAVLEPVLAQHVSPLVVEPLRTASEPVLEPLRTARAPRFPLEEKRTLTPVEADEARRLYDTMSKTELCRLVYGSKNGQYMEWLNEALNAEPQPQDRKIIRLRPTGTGGD